MEEKKHGGVRKGAGRPTKVDEDKSKELMRAALKKLYNKDEDDDNTIEFLRVFAQTSRGQQFIAEHLLGKPKEHVINEIIIEDEIDLSKYNLKDLKESISESDKSTD